MGTKELRDNLKKAESEISFDEKTGPIVDVLGDISHDADMLQKVAAKNSDSMEPLEYIMRRLDRIENSINAREPISSNLITNVMVTIDCDEVDEEKDTPRIHSVLTKLLIASGCEMTAFDVADNAISIGVRGPASYLDKDLHLDIFNALTKLKIRVFSSESSPILF